MVLLAIVLLISGCGPSEDVIRLSGEVIALSEKLEDLTAKLALQTEEVAVISTSYGDIVITFFPEVAPNHVESFILHARSGYFDEAAFHRIIPGFVIQGGDPYSRDEDRSNDVMGCFAAKYYGHGDVGARETWTLPQEFNDRPHKRGALSMARSEELDSGGSQFFICVDDVRRLDNKYTVFGEVIKGLDVVDKIVNTPRDKKDNPLEKVAMSVKILNRGQIHDI